MTEGIWIALIVAVSGIANMWLSNRHHKENKQTLAKTAEATGELEKKINSRMDEFVEQVRKLAHAAGIEEERKRRGE